jgi:hypothetical protein
MGNAALEAVHDPPGNRIGQDVAPVSATAPPGTAFEWSIHLLGAPVRLLLGDYRVLSGQHRLPAGRRIGA